MTKRLAELACLVDGALRGDGEVTITEAQPIEQVEAGQITLADHTERIRAVANSPAAAVVIGPDVACDELAIPVIVVADVHRAFSQIVGEFRSQRVRPRGGISPAACVSPNAILGDEVTVHPGATIGDDVKIGDRTEILPGAHLMPGVVVGSDVSVGPGAVIYEDCQVGDRCLLHAGVVIGANGFGYRQEAGRHLLGPQLGTVVIENDVEIGANTTVDRGSYSPTVIGEGTKIDNLVQIAHNCQIGKHNMICSQVGIAGSSTTGDYVVMGGQVGVRDHVSIGNGAVLTAMAGIVNHVPDGEVMLGIPATPQRKQKLQMAAVSKLPSMRKDFRALVKQVAQLQQRLPQSQPDAAPKDQAA